MTEPDQAKIELPKRSDVVGRIVSWFTGDDFGTGPLAELRRLDPAGRLSEPALHRMLARVLPDEWLGGTGVRDWALVIHCLALAAPDNLRGESRLGTALQEAGYGEIRFINLLDAGADELRIRLPRAVRFLVQRGGRLHGLQLTDFVLTPPQHAFHEAVRQRVARDYYRAEHRAAQADTPSAA